ncbi:unnamed protein product, partial [marine sediment metagenome]
MQDKRGRQSLIREQNIKERKGMQLVLRKINQDFSNNPTLLEVGGGTGQFSIQLSQMAYNIVCT